MRRWFWTSVLLVGVAACDGVHPESKGIRGSGEASSVPTDLQDGSYSCEAYNSTRGTGPYALDCEKSGDSVTLHFPNGGHVELDLDSQDTADGTSWEIEATDAESGDSWTITITR